MPPQNYPAPYANDGRKKVAAIFQRYVGVDYVVTDVMMVCITRIDNELYSEAFRTSLRDILAPIADTSVLSFLQTPEDTRKHLYRFFMKGSTVIPIIQMYLEKKYDNRDIVLNRFSAENDWDTTVLINPDLPPPVFTHINEQIVQTLQRLLVELSNLLADHQYFLGCLAVAIETNGNNTIQTDDTYSEFRKYPIHLKTNSTPERYIYLQNEPANVNAPALAKSLGPVGRGINVSSNRNVGHLGKFYLGRLMARVIASRNIPIPVELLDVSIPFQGEELRYAWESHSEYHIVFNHINMRIMSPTSLYADLIKCIRNSQASGNETRKNKTPARIRRITTILNEIIIPYSPRNEIMSANLERHLESPTPVGNIFRNLNMTIRNRRRANPIITD